MQPKRLQGMRDHSPDYMITLNSILALFRKTVESFGFSPMSTPSLEYSETLVSKTDSTETHNELYQWQDKGGREIGLRYDHTVPLARYMSMNPNVILPFKRYTTGSVWRFNRPQKGRYREFLQADLDIVGSGSINSDAEILTLISKFLNECLIDKYEIRVNNRILLEQLAAKAGITENDYLKAFRIIDKLDKVGTDNTIQLLTKCLGEKVAKTFFYSLFEPQQDKRTLDILNLAQYMGASNLRTDQTLARGLNYYTSTIFEVIIPGVAGSIAGGGRFDKFIENKGKFLPTVGVGLGISRIMDLITEDPRQPQNNGHVTHVLVADCGLLDESLNIADNLRHNNYRVEVYHDKDRLKKQLKYANNKKIPCVVLIGPDEYKAGKVRIKNMETSKEVLVEQTMVNNAVFDVLC